MHNALDLDYGGRPDVYVVVLYSRYNSLGDIESTMCYIPGTILWVILRGSVWSRTRTASSLLYSIIDMLCYIPDIIEILRDIESTMYYIPGTILWVMLRGSDWSRMRIASSPSYSTTRWPSWS